MAMMETFTFNKASGTKVKLTVAYLDNETDKLESADNHMYDPNSDLHYVRLDSATVLILDNIPVNRTLLTNYQLVANEADVQFGLGCKKKPVTGSTPVITLQAALQQLNYRRTISILSELFMSIVQLPGTLSVTKPTADHQLLLPNQMYATLTYTSSQVFNTDGTVLSPYNINASTAGSPSGTIIPFTTILNSRGFKSSQLVSETTGTAPANVTQYGVILIEQPGVYLCKGVWTVTSAFPSTGQPRTRITINDQLLETDIGASSDYLSVPFFSLVQITQAHLDAKSDGKARLKFLATHTGTSGTSLPLSTDATTNKVQILLMG